ncbi:hypothetical protein ACNUDN_30945 (plasmid) [Mycobacterium sp. smrl_JER01]|uniref:hypothetical protein n=1 Tax=Mycobacteriaceae TaxID=1762 RepID=UPI003AC28B4A
MPQHPYGGAYYALRAIAARSPDQSVDDMYEERQWQAGQLPDHLRAESWTASWLKKAGGASGYQFARAPASEPLGRQLHEEQHT